MKEKETWRQYLNTNYLVSNLGNIKGPKGMMKGYPNTSGYLQVGIYDGHGKRKKTFVHIMVATCFVLNPNGYKFVHHRDENPHNNRADNLEWVATASHSGKRSKEKKKQNRERRRKCIAQIDIDIIRVWSREELKQQKEFYWPYILRCCNIRNGVRHRGYTWKYFNRYYQRDLFNNKT